MRSKQRAGWVILCIAVCIAVFIAVCACLPSWNGVENESVLEAVLYWLRNLSK